MDECKLMGVSPIPRIITIPRIYIRGRLTFHRYLLHMRVATKSITLRVMRINDTLDKEFMTFLLPLFSDLIISLGKGDPFRKIDQQFLLVFFSAVRELSGKRPCFRYLRVKNARARNHESSSRIDCSRIERKKYFFFCSSVHEDLIMEMYETTISILFFRSFSLSSSALLSGLSIQ